MLDRTKSPSLNVGLWGKQGQALLSPGTEILYGGAAGGGKSYLMRVAAINWALDIPGLQIYLFRRIWEDLVKNHVEGPKGFRVMLAPLVNEGWCSIGDDQIRFCMQRPTATRSSPRPRYRADRCHAGEHEVGAL
jgi:hypothetical protein